MLGISMANQYRSVHPKLRSGFWALALLGVAGTCSAETRGYAISLVHTATYADPSHCPRGGNGATTEIHTRILMDQGHTKEEAIKILTGNERKVDFEHRGTLNNEKVDIGNFPMSVPDPKIETAQGKYAYGFDLDGKAAQSGFIDPETHEPVENQMWRVLGCFTSYQYRLPGIPYNEGITWDTAMDSMPAWLLSISGNDLDHDGDVTVTFDRALDVLIRNTRGGVLAGSSYTIDTDPRSHSEFKGHIKNHVVTIEPGNFFMQGESQFYPVLRFTHTHLRFTLNPDGTIRGFIGGYQPWLDYYHYVSVRGEEDGQIDIPGVYYAMRRLADADPDPVTGQNRSISAAYYMEATPAYLLSRTGQVVAAPHIPGVK